MFSKILYFVGGAAITLLLTELFPEAKMILKIVVLVAAFILAGYSLNERSQNLPKGG